MIDGRRLTADRTGVGRYLEVLLGAWEADGLPLPSGALVLQDEKVAEGLPRPRGLEIRAIGAGQPGLAWETFALGAVLRRGDLLFAPANWVPWWWKGRTLLVLQDLIQFAEPGAFPARVRWQYGWRYHLAAKRATRIVASSESTAADASRFLRIDPAKLSVIYPGISPEFRRIDPDAPEIGAVRERFGLGDDPYFLFVGKPTARRRLPEVIRAIGEARESGHGWKLVLVGPCAKIEGDFPGIVKAGHLPDGEIRALMGGAAALVYPSSYEGFGLPVVEAMACGCPAITCRKNALAEAAGDAALFLESTDAEAIRRAMMAAVEDQPLRERLIARGLRRAEEFAAARFARRMADAIRSMTKAQIPDDAMASSSSISGAKPRRMVFSVTDRASMNSSR